MSGKIVKLQLVRRDLQRLVKWASEDGVTPGQMIGRLVATERIRRRDAALAAMPECPSCCGSGEQYRPDDASGPGTPGNPCSACGGSGHVTQ